MVCNLCSSNSLSLRYTLSSEGYKIMLCRNCGLQFIEPIPDKDNLYRFYQNSYFAAWGVQLKSETSLTGLKELYYKSIFKEAERFIGAGRFLDIGCAFGHSFNLAIKRGWDPYGVEISQEAYKVAAKGFPSKIIFGDFCEAELSNNFFDLVVMSDFLEHTRHLVNTMQKSHNILKPKGLVAIVTPNLDSFSAHLMRKKWMHIKPEHIFYLSKRTLKLLFLKTGFKPILFKNFWKPINLLYVRSQIKTYGKQYQVMFLKLLTMFIPDYLQRLNIFLPQGEILAIGQKSDK